MSGIPVDTSNSVMSKYLIVLHKVLLNGINGIDWYHIWYRQRLRYHQYHLPLGNGMVVGSLGLVLP
jgi:hypothetical protein